MYVIVVLYYTPFPISPMRTSMHALYVHCIEKSVCGFVACVARSYLEAYTHTHTHRSLALSSLRTRPPISLYIFLSYM